MPPVTNKKTSPVWAGPSSPDPNGGVTQSLLGRFLFCRERFRLLVVEGLKPADTFSHRLEYGNMWHVCEEALAQQGSSQPSLLWQRNLTTYCERLCRRYITQQDQIDKWYNVCKVQFPLYVDYWAKHQDVVDRTPLLQEQVFHVPYKLPSGRTVYLRGKWDAVDLIGKGKAAGIYLFETKTKGDINEQQLKRQLTYDLQTMLYLIALHDQADFEVPSLGPTTISGVRYNVIRRPLSGGRGSIVQHKPSRSNPFGEKKEDYYSRLGGLIAEAPQDYFMRWKVEIHSGDIAKFKRECLDPILEQLCTWWDWVNDQSTEYHTNPGGRFFDANSGIHYRLPYGVYNPLLEGNVSDLDEHLATGGELGLTRTDNLFPELG